MSLVAYRYAWQMIAGGEVATRGDSLVLLALADHHNRDTGDCWPSYTRLAAMTGLARSNVKRGIWRLETAGLIAIVRHPGRPSIYRFPIADADLAPAPGGLLGEPGSYPQPGAHTRPPTDVRRARPRAHTGRAHAPTPGAPTRPESELTGSEPGALRTAAEMRAIAEAARREALEQRGIIEL